VLVRRVLSCLLAVAVPVFVVALGANSIWDHNEAFYVETPRQMLLRGDYVTPYFNDATRLNKPVLSYWIVAGLYHVLGVSVTTERIGIALGAFGIIASAFVIGRAVRGTTTGLLSALIVATAPRVVMHSRRIFIDVYITCFMSLTLACFVLAERYPQHRRKALFAMYVCIGLGMLTKGPIALAFPVATAALWFTLEKRWSDVRRLDIIQGLLIMAVIVSPWYLALYQTHGWEPIRTFLLGENVDRYLNSMVPGDDQRPFYFYVFVLLTDLFPWAPLGLIPLVTAWRRDPGTRDLAPGTRDLAPGTWNLAPGTRISEPGTVVRSSLRRLLWCWIVVIVGVFSLSATKQDLYIFPTVAALAVLIADLLVAKGLGAESAPLRWTLAGVGVTIVIAGGVIAAFFAFGVYALAAAPIAAGILIVGGCVVAASAAARRPPMALVALAWTFIAFNYVFVVRVLPSVERFKPSPVFARLVEDRGGPNDRLGSYDYMFSSLVYYAARPVNQFGTPPELEQFVADGHGWVVMKREVFDVLKPTQPNLCVAASSPVFGAKTSELLAGKAPTEVVLVGTRCG
jgi:4-amino-4-deoxy-L-arabinose transferase-like glycosyltransferase